MSEPEILDISEAAAFCKLSVSTMYRVAAAGGEDSPFRKRRGRWLTTKARLVAWVEAGEIGTRRPTGAKADPMPMPRRRPGDAARLMAQIHNLREAA